MPSTKAPTFIKISVLDGKLTGGQTEKSFPCLLPHTILAYLFNETELSISPELVTTYWEHMRAVGHPAARKFDGDRFIPLGFHGDEAAYGADKTAPGKLLVLTMDLPLWRPKTARLSRFPLFAMNMHQFVGYESLHPVLQKIVESFNFAFFGVDGAGAEIAGGKRFALTELRGDLVWHRQIWRMKRWWRTKLCCWRCDAATVSTSGPLYYETGEHAGWRDTLTTTVEFLGDGLPDQLPCRVAQGSLFFSVISRDVFAKFARPCFLGPFAAAYGFDIENIKFCSLHTCNLGLRHSANGGCLKLLLDLGCFGDPADHISVPLAEAFDDFRMWCRQMKVSCSQRRFRVHHLMKKANGAYLTAKGHNSRVITQWLCDCVVALWSQMWPAGRKLGKWLGDRGAQPEDDRVAPTAMAMTLCCILAKLCCFSFWSWDVWGRAKDWAHAVVLLDGGRAEILVACTQLQRPFSCDKVGEPGRGNLQVGLDLFGVPPRFGPDAY